MPITKEKKERIVTELKNNLQRQKAIFLIGYKGLGTNQINELRKELKKVGADFQIVKKTLIKIAFKSFEKEKFQDQIAIVFGYKDEVNPAKIIYNFSEKATDLKILGGYLEGDFINKEKIIELAKLEPKEELLEKLIFVIKNPIYRFVDTLNGNTKKLISVLNAIKKAKEA